MNIRQIITSWDIWVAIAVSILTYVLMPSALTIEFCRDAYFAGLTVLAIVFAIFFAAIAIIMASSDDKFISFLEERGHYTILVNTFRYTLILLFLSFLLSIVLYLYTLFQFSQGISFQPKFFFILFVFLSSYALFAVCISNAETLTYSKYRIQFLKIQRDKTD